MARRYNQSKRSKAGGISSYVPHGWFEHRSAGDYAAHVRHEFGRLGIEDSDLPGPVGEVYWSLQCHRDNEYALEDMLTPAAWDLVALQERIDEARKRFTQLNEFPRPRALVHPYVTSKGNLSVVWRPRPIERHSEQNDWAIPISAYTPSYQRPTNELIFIRGVQYLRSWIGDAKSRLRARRLFPAEEAEGLAFLCSDLISWTRAQVQELVDQIGRVLDVEVTQAFYFSTEPVTRPDDEWFKAEVVTSWDLLPPDEFQKREMQDWLKSFPDQFGMSHTQFLRIMASEGKTRTTLKKDLEVAGGKSLSFATIKHAEERLATLPN